MKFDNVAPIDAAARRVELPLGKTVVTFLVTHCDARSPEYLRIKQRLSKPVRKLIEVDMLPPAKDREIAIATFVEHCVVGWEGVTSEGASVPFSRDACCELFKQSPATFYSLITEAEDVSNFKPSEGDAGN